MHKIATDCNNDATHFTRERIHAPASHQLYCTTFLLVRACWSGGVTRCLRTFNDMMGAYRASFIVHRSFPATHRRGALLPSALFFTLVLGLFIASELSIRNHECNVLTARQIGAEAAAIIKRMDHAIHLERQDPTSSINAIPEPQGIVTLDLSGQFANVRSPSDPVHWYQSTTTQLVDGPSTNTSDCAQKTIAYPMGR